MWMLGLIHFFNQYFYISLLIHIFMIVGEITLIIITTSLFIIGSILMYIDREYPTNKCFIGSMLILISSSILIYILSTVIDWTPVIAWWNMEI